MPIVCGWEADVAAYLFSGNDPTYIWRHGYLSRPRAAHLVATGEYDKMLDKKIAEIQTTCHVK
jgi:hypothetical protein